MYSMKTQFHSQYVFYMSHLLCLLIYTRKIVLAILFLNLFLKTVKILVSSI